MKINIQELFIEKAAPVLKENNQVRTDQITNESNTAEIYKSRKLYKEQVNDKNLPVGQVNGKGDNLNNQLDTWYKEKKYIKYDYQDRLIVLNKMNLKEFESGFKLLDFVADAAEQFFKQYNIQRNGHPKSSLNDIKIVRAYEPIKNYSDYVEKIYVSFFNEVLSPIRNTKKIKTFNDFLNLFYSWFIGKDIAITKPGFYEKSNYSIYNTGMAFDFFNVTSEEDKATILNDVRFPVLNYVAKMNGLRIDPNNPGTLIADIQSEKLLQLYASESLDEKNLLRLPEMILDKYFKRQEFSKSSYLNIVELFAATEEMYRRFIKKYPTYVDYNAPSKIDQLYKKEFTTSKINRQQPLPVLVDGLPKEYVEYYIKIRAKENNIILDNATLLSLTKNVFELVKIARSSSFKKGTSFKERDYIVGQPINYLELFLKQTQSGESPNGKNITFFWQRGKIIK